MQPCSRCGAEVADVTGFCLNCGPLVDMADFKDAMQFMRDRVAKVAELLATGKLDDAASTCEQLTHMDPTNGALFSLLGDIYRHQGTPRKATEAYQAAINAHPDGAARYRLKLDALIDSTLAREPRPPTLTTSLPDAAPLPTRPAAAPPPRPTPAAAPRAHDHLVVAQAPQETKLVTEEEMPTLLLGVIPLTPGNVRAVFTISALIIVLSLLLSFHPWKSKYHPPTQVISLSDDDTPPPAPTPAPPTPTVGNGVIDLTRPTPTGTDAASSKGGR